MTPVRVRVLGPLVVEGHDLAAVGSRKARTLLAALAAAGGEPVAVGDLIEVLWGDQLPAKPADQVSVLASRLRSVLGAERITRTDHGYALRTVWIDVVELDARCDEAAARLVAGRTGAARAAAASAVELLRGPLAADEGGEWFEERRRSVDRTTARARSVLAEAAIATGDPMTAAAAAGDALADDPYDEAALRILMRAHVALGRPASALAAYAQVRARLGEDLGVDPSPETEALHTSILLGEADRSVGIVREAVLFGRDDELAALHGSFEEAAAGATVGVLIEGEAGIGKSALTAAFLESVRDRTLVVYGRCDEMGRDLPLQPIVDGLEAHLRTLPDGTAAEMLGADVDVVAPLVGRSTSRAGTSVTTIGDSEAARAVLYRAVLAVVERLAASRPIVIAIEDVHLAGTSTLTWLQMALRRGKRTLVVITQRPEGGGSLAGVARLDIGPLEVDAVRDWLGSTRAADLVARSGGNPLFLAELAEHVGDDLPPSIRELVAVRVDGLRDSGSTLRAAAVLGPEIDLDLLSNVLQLRVEMLLDHLERAVVARLLAEDARGLRFRHELVREALEASTSSARRAFLHREATTVLAGRASADPLVVAWHAQHSGDHDIAADALVRAAAVASARFDLDEARNLLDQAITLRDDAAARLARARNRMAAWDLEAARLDADRAIELEGGGSAFEVAGWVAYYRRAHNDTLRFAEAGMASGNDDAVRASCLSLSGRTQHALGELDTAEAHLRQAVAIAPVELRAVASVWLAQVRSHRGDDIEAIDLLHGAELGLDRKIHPFAPAHALFARVQALGHGGDVVSALAVADQLDGLVARGGAQLQRFGPMSRNLRGWLLRNVGALDDARTCNEVAAALPADDPPYAEPRFAGHLDLVEHELVLGDIDAAVSRLDGIAEIEEWHGSMHWRHRTRFRLQRARVALARGDGPTALDLARDVEAECQRRAVRRYELIASLVATRAGAPIEREQIDATLRELDDIAGLEVWWITAEMAAHLDDDPLWDQAQRRLETLSARAGGHAGTLRAHAAERFAALREVAVTRQRGR